MTRKFNVFMLNLMLAVCLVSCGEREVKIRLTEEALTCDGRVVTVKELEDELLGMVSKGDTPMVRLTIYPEASMGEVFEIRNTISKASIRKVRQFMK